MQSFASLERDETRREKVDKIWSQFDENGDGVLDKEEAYRFLRVSLKEFSGQEPSDEDIERNFESIDFDKNGVLDKDEVYRYLKGFEMGLKL